MYTVQLPVGYDSLCLLACFWHTHTHPFNGPFSGTPGWAGTRKVKPIWILLEQEAVSGSGIRWAICKSASHSNHASTPPLVFLQAGCPSCRPTNSVKALKAKACYWQCMRNVPCCTSTTNSRLYIAWHWRNNQSISVPVDFYRPLATHRLLFQ